MVDYSHLLSNMLTFVLRMSLLLLYLASISGQVSQSGRLFALSTHFLRLVNSMLTFVLHVAVDIATQPGLFYTLC